MIPKSSRQVEVCAEHAQVAVRDWLETQSRITGYWREVLVSAGGDEELIAMLDSHASFLAAAARWGEGKIVTRQ